MAVAKFPAPAFNPKVPVKNSDWLHSTGDKNFIV